MDAIESKALLALSVRPIWALDELPGGVDIDVLRGLDASEFIEVRLVLMVGGSRSHAGHTVFQPAPQTWYSPSRDRGPHGSRFGTWDVVFRQNVRGARDHPPELRLTDRGRAEVARLRRKELEVPGARVPQDEESDIAKNFRNAFWISRATKGGLDSEVLRKCRERGGLARTKPQGRYFLYFVPEVANEYPQYSEVLLRALKENRSYRKHSP